MTDTPAALDDLDFVKALLDLLIPLRASVDVSGADAGCARSRLSLAVQPFTAMHHVPDERNSGSTEEQHYFHASTIGGMPTAQ